MTETSTFKYARKSACPADVILDRLHLGELSRRERKATLSHLEGCPDCVLRMEERSRGWEAFPELDAERMQQRIQEALPADAGQVPGIRRRPIVAWALAGCAAAAATVWLALWIWNPPREAGQTVRIKGSVRMRVHRKRGSGSEEVASGEAFRPGDRLKFEVSLPGPGHLMVVGSEAGGRLFAGHPVGAKESVSVGALSGAFLPGAIELDQSLGEEWLYLVVCPRPFGIDQLKVGKPGILKLPPGCQSDSFRMIKEAP